MKCDELKPLMCAHEPNVRPMYDKSEVDSAIDELKTEHHRERHEYIEMVAQFRRENAELKQKLEDVNELIKTARQMLEDEKATHYAKSVDAGMENRKLKRALWLARAELCHRLDVDRYLRNHRKSWYNENCLTWADACVAMEVKMGKAESKCRAKAEEYK